MLEEHIFRFRAQELQPAFSRMQAFFKGKTAVVTGGASGIGRATAVLLKRLGATVMVGDRQKPAAADGLLYAPCDVAAVADIERLLTGAVNQMGHVDLWYGRRCCRTCAWCLGGWGLGLTLCSLC